jgi:hypothetical protein
MVRQTVLRTLKAISWDVLHSKDVTLVSDSSVVLSGGMGSRPTDSYDGRWVWRNRDFIDSTNGLHLSLKISRSHPLAKAYPDLISIVVTGKFKTLVFQASTNVAPSPSGRAEFLYSQDHQE